MANTSNSMAARGLFRLLYYVLPNLTNFSQITAAAHGLTPASGSFALAALYMVVYVAILLCVATLIFGRRNFK
jgi:hypothetical protein